ncbi:MAG: RNA-binding S4 domain-containing protein [Brevinematales bacterium]|nr:RNA-binding S4 domain-containing protein [Brevinematales bacterium]
MGTNEPMDGVRIDKWLKFARFFKQRSVASEAVEGGHVKINGERAKPARIVRPGDELLILIGNDYRKVTVKGIVQRSISKADARELYEMEEKAKPEGELAEYIEIIERQERINRREQTGNINKKQRRELHKHKYGDR